MIDRLLRSAAAGLSWLPAAAAAAAVLLLSPGCGKDDVGFRIDNLRPQVGITFSPLQRDSVQYVITLNWVGTDADGRVERYLYAVDPPAQPGPGVDTLWVETRENTKTLTFLSRTPRDPLPPGANLPSSDYHTFVIVAIDNEGLRSAPLARSFTTFTIAPWSTIVRPNGTSQLSIGTPPTITLEWTGEDPDGTARPVKYKYLLVTAEQIKPENPLGILKADVQEYFERFSADYFAGWDSVGGDTTSLFLEGLTPGVRYYFALVAFDEAGAFEPRFSMDSNVLNFTPSLDRLGPSIRIFNEFLSHTQAVGGVDPITEARWVKMEYPAGAGLTFNWLAFPPKPGAVITGYRWAVDLRDVGDETPRRDENDVGHWSPWSLLETSARIGPFTAPEGGFSTHFFLLEARDNLGFISLLTVRIRILHPGFAKDVLLVDDTYGSLTQSDGQGGLRLPPNSWPLEAEQDSFYVAVGGVPDRLYEAAGFPGTLSQPGIFADYAVDTLDYRSSPHDGVPLEVLSQYRAVCWYSDSPSASRSGSKFGGASPMTALRALHSVNRLNTLAVYARQGGNVWLFGEGATTSIGNGYWSRVGGAPPIPYTSGEDPRAMLVPGNFLYDFCHLRSELSLGGGTTYRPTQLLSCLPYLPGFRGPAADGERELDPRVGPGAERTAQRWGDLPRLTLAYRGAPADPAISSTWYLSEPNRITGGPPAFEPELDTLYLYQARAYDPLQRDPYAADGFPNAVHYHGPDNGPGSQLVWFGFPLHYFEPARARAVVGAVMRNFGIAKRGSAAPVARR